MTIPPLLLRVRLVAPNHRWPTLWLPVVLLWPLLLPLVLVLVLPALLFLCIVAPRSIGAAFSVVFAAYALLCATRGTSIDVAGGPSAVFIAVD
jgi:hypothetical protein